MVKWAYLGVKRPHVCLWIDDNRLALVHSGLNTVQKVLFLIKITTQRYYTVGLHSQTHSSNRQNVRMTDDEALFRKGCQRADVGIALHLGVVADNKATVLFGLL